MTYKPIDDDTTKMNLADFVTEMTDALKDYEKAFFNANDWTKQDHTFIEWLAHFQRFMSF